MIMRNENKNKPAHVGYLLRMYPRFSQTFIVNEILELQRQGLHVSIGSLKKPADGIFHESISRVDGKVHYFSETILSDFVKLWRAHWPRWSRRPVSHLRAIGCVLRNAGANWLDLAQAALVLRWVRKQKIDHVHVHFGTNEATVALLANMLGGLSYSLTLHAFDIFRDNVDRRLLARKINASRFTVTVSEYNKRFLTSLPGVHPEKVRVNYNGIDLDRFQSNGADRAPTTVFGVGRLIEKKGFIHLVRAIERLHDSGMDVRCRIAGDGPEKSRLKAEIKRAGLKSHVELTGPLEQNVVREEMQRAGCFVLPCVEAKDGNVDALPTVLLESLGCSCPSISTRISGVPEIIEDGVSGLLVEPEDEAGLAEAIRRIVEDASFAERLSVGSRERAADRFDVRKNVAIMHEWLLNAAVSRHARSNKNNEEVQVSTDRAFGPVAAKVP